MWDVLAPGDVVGQGVLLQGEPIRLISVPPTIDYEAAPAPELEVVRRLGAGSYAVVYLVREVLFRPVPSLDSHMSLEGMELDDKLTGRPSVEYGREFAIKCLSKANLDEEALAAQMSEVTIHQSLRSHPNIATLHRTFETSSFLLLLLEYVPGEDLFYFLEQARDHYDPDSPPSADLAISSSRTPPTPSLLSNMHPSQLLSRNRLRLIASMFSQMCEAVAACHDQQVFHRDIKPENFIVTDGWMTLPDGRRERRVIVKLTDFGLSTTDLESSDMDCGSAPYMSFECRNNVAPTYKPRAADVWSLGIVLINMLYHYNPWQDTAHGTCSSFDIYRQQPINFFMQRFAGMTRPVAEFLTSKVFCIFEDPQDDSQRIEAREFGAWIKDLPTLLGDTPVLGHKRVISTSSMQGFPIALSNPQSRRPSSRQPSFSLRTPGAGCRSLSRAPSLEPAYEVDGLELPTVFDQEVEDEESVYSRSASTTKRRKRGARKGKGSAAAAAAAGVSTAQSSAHGSVIDDPLDTLATASQSLAREISRASRSSMPRSELSLESAPPLPAIKVLPKKPSKWKLSFGKHSSSANERPATAMSSSTSFIDDTASSETGRSMSAKASNVTNLLMGLSAPPQSPSGIAQLRTKQQDGDDTRGRRPKQQPPTPSVASAPKRDNPRRYSPPSMYAPTAFLAPEHKWSDKRTVSPRRAKSPRALSPASTRSGRPLASSASSMTSNWRNSTSSTASSNIATTSVFTRYSNSSSRSVSTTATSLSASSWRTQGTAEMPKNVKNMNGVPWELDQLPRGMHPNPIGDIFGSPPVPRKQRVRKPRDKLDTIVERSGMSPKAPVTVSENPESTKNPAEVEDDVVVEDEDGVPKKVQRGQINALAKMLSALRR
jgi:serine/threonine protein kinase